jgi:transcriptional regulator with XRE-family HTH domain
MVINEQDIYGLTNKQVLRSLGLRMKERRVNSACLTQKELAERSGVSPMTVAGMEAGKNISLETFIAILRAMDELAVIHKLFIAPEPVRPSVQHKLDKIKAKSTRKRVRKQLS